MSEIFTPFVPAPAIVPEAPAPKGTHKAAKAPKRERKVKAVNEAAAVPAPPAPTPKKARKKRTVPKVRVPRSVKLPVGEMLAAMAELNAGDGALFEKLLGLLTAAGKSERQRVLAALGKVF